LHTLTAFLLISDDERMAPPRDDCTDITAVEIADNEFANDSNINGVSNPFSVKSSCSSQRQEFDRLTATADASRVDDL